MEDNSTRNFNNATNNQNGGSFSYGVNRPQSTQPQSSQQQNNTDQLRKLSQQLSPQSGNNEKKKRRRRIIIWIILIILLLAVIGAGIYFFIKGQGSIDLGTNIRLSINTDEKLDADAGDKPISATAIYPGESFPIVVEVRNSNNFDGDSTTTDVAPIFVRFKVELKIGDKIYNNVVVPTIQANNWCIYNPETETRPSDGYYYYYGQLISHESVVLFSNLTFDFANTTNELAGKNAEIIITAEAVEAKGENIGEGEAWGSAPDVWLNYIKTNFGE